MIHHHQRECARRPTSSNGLYNVGCYEAVQDFVEDNKAIIGGIAIGILVMMVSARTSISHM